MKYNHLEVECFHCKKKFEQRKDTIKRQLSRYGHSTCKHCFGNEKSFKDARKRVMLANNPFKGKTHTDEVKQLLSTLKTGSTGWNKGLTKETNESIRNYAERASIALKGKYAGDQNPNWKGGVSSTSNYGDKYRFPPDYNAFRMQMLKDDGYKCWVCERDRQLQIHHMASRTKYPEGEMDELNCITLCKKCHKEFHGLYGIKRFEPHHTIEWINSKRAPEHKLQMC